MAKLEMTGLNEFMVYLSRLQDRRITEQICESVLNAGAEVMLDAVRERLDAIPKIGKAEETEITKKIYKIKRKSPASGSITPRPGIRTGITEEERENLSSSLGKSPMREKDSVYDVKIGFAGYGKRKTKKYPSGVPNQLLARAINSGTSFRFKTNFLTYAQNDARRDVLQKMQEELEKQIQQRMSEIYNKL